MKSFICEMFYKQRAAFEQSCASRGKEYPLPEDVFLQSDIFYDEKHVPAHRLDVYRPRGRDGEILPVIVNVHGGGLLIGNKEFNRPFCASLCEAGYLVFSIEYRLIPDCLFYDQLTDLPVRALGLVSGMFYTNRLDQIGLFLPRYLYGRHYKKSAFAPYVSPEHPDIVTSLPPSLLITSDNDNLQSYTLNFEKALRRHQMPHKLINYPKDPRLTHAFSAFYPELPESREVIHHLIHFFEHTGEECKGGCVS